MTIRLLEYCNTAKLFLLYRLEVTGRFPTAEEAFNLSLRPDIPTWLPQGPDKLSDDAIPIIVKLRKVVLTLMK